MFMFASSASSPKNASWFVTLVVIIYVDRKLNGSTTIATLALFILFVLRISAAVNNKIANNKI
jgi:hypothetical protein